MLLKSQNREKSTFWRDFENFTKSWISAHPLRTISTFQVVSGRLLVHIRWAEIAFWLIEHWFSLGPKSKCWKSLKSQFSAKFTAQKAVHSCISAYLKMAQKRPKHTKMYSSKHFEKSIPGAGIWKIRCFLASVALNKKRHFSKSWKMGIFGQFFIKFQKF